MKNILELLIVFAITFCAYGSSFGQQASNERTVGVITESKGKVRLLSDRKWSSGNTGSKINQGDLIVTGADGRAQIWLKDDSVLHLGSSTKIKVTNLTINREANSRKAKFAMYFGKLRTVVTSFFGKRSSFDVHTPTAVAGVRGSEMILDSPEDGPTVIINVFGTIIGHSRISKQTITLKPMEMMKLSSSGRKASVGAASPIMVQKAQEATSLDGQDYSGSILEGYDNDFDDDDDAGDDDDDTGDDDDDTGDDDDNDTEENEPEGDDDSGDDSGDTGGDDSGVVDPTESQPPSTPSDQVAQNEMIFGEEPVSPIGGN